MAKEHYKEGRNAARIRVAEVLSLGYREQPDNVVRQMINSEKIANSYLSQTCFGDSLIYLPSDAMPCSVVFEKSTIPQAMKSDYGRWCLIADGHGWQCLWGEWRAKFGRIMINATFEGDPFPDGLAYLGEG